MTFVAFARWAIPRNVQLSAWSRQLAMNMRTTRGLAAVSLMAAEPRPLQGFVEQRGSIPFGAVRQESGESIDELSNAAAAQAVASVLNGMGDLDCVTISLSEMLDLNLLTLTNGSSCGVTTYKRGRDIVYC